MKEAETRDGSKGRVKLRLSQEAERYVRRDAPLESRRIAAGGALPLPPVELATVLFALLHDPDPTVKDRARQSLDDLPDALELLFLPDTHIVRDAVDIGRKSNTP